MGDSRMVRAGVLGLAFLLAAAPDAAAQQTTYRLSVSTSPAGGSVASDIPPQINCGASATDCSFSYPAGTNINLIATTDPAYTHEPWGGACASAGTSNVCSLTMDGDKQVSAGFKFIQVTKLELLPVANGSVGCAGAACSRWPVVPTGSTIALTAAPNEGYKFSRWVRGGEVVCASTGSSCEFTVSSAGSETIPIVPEFAPIGTGKITVVILPFGGGALHRVTPEGYSGVSDCGTDQYGTYSNCEFTYTNGTNVTFTVFSITPNDAHTSVLWGGICQGRGQSLQYGYDSSGACTITVQGDAYVTVTFVRK